MSRHEIEIEGLPEGWEISDLVFDTTSAYPRGKEQVLTATVVIRRKVRKYDWSKTLDDVLTTIDGCPGYFPAAGNYESSGIAEIWQTNIHGKCPVDGEASVVRVRRAYGAEYEELAKNIEWRFLENPILGWQFIRLADGVEWV